MATRLYMFDYDNSESEVTFSVDTEKFTHDSAKAFLDFFVWDEGPDYESDLIDEAMKKVALRAIWVGAQREWNEQGVADEIAALEGYPKINGECGIQIHQLQNYEFREFNLSMTRTVTFKH